MTVVGAVTRGEGTKGQAARKLGWGGQIGGALAFRQGDVMRGSTQGREGRAEVSDEE